MRKYRSLWLYGLTLGLLIASLQFMKYKVLLADYRLEWYTGVIAASFLIIGVWAGWQFRRQRTRSNPGAKGAAGSPADVGLTSREHEVLLLIAAGLSNQEMAERLFVSTNTIKSHVSNLFAKLAVQRRTQAIQKARELGLI